MNRWTVVLAASLMLVALGCSSGSGGSPVTPTAEPAITNPTSHTGQSQTHLWGYYDVYLDIESKTIEAVPNREVMFAANVVQFLNGKPTNLQFTIWETPMGVGYVDVDIDVKIMHPFPGMPMYNGYDVRGVFIGNGSALTKYNSDLKYAAYGGTDQVMYDYDLSTADPPGLGGMPDGYTRWWNPKEFGTPGLFGYTTGKVATPGYTGMATLNPYKYFADGLTASADLMAFLKATTKNGVFSSGLSNIRNYYLRFPIPVPNVKYNYAVVANWIDETTHPANAPEAVACMVDVTPDVYYVDPTSKGGKLILDISLFDWDSTVGGSGYMEDYNIWVESTVLTAAYKLDTTELTPTVSGTHWYTYHVEIPADKIESRDNQQYWVIAECALENYVTGVPNSAGADKLAACYRYDLFVNDEPYNLPPVINSGVDGEVEPIEWTVETYNVDATDPNGDPMTYTWTLTDGNGDPVEGYDGVPGDGAGNLDIDWGEVAGWTQGPAPYDIDCEVSDGTAPPVPATTLSVEVWVAGDKWVSNHTDFGSVPDNGTKSEPYSTINQALASYSEGTKIIVDKGSANYTDIINLSSRPGFVLRGWSWYTTPFGRPTLTNTSTYAIYLNYTNNVTIQGFKLMFPVSSYQYYLIYGNYSNNLKIIDNWGTGSTLSYYVNLFYTYYCNDLTITNNLFSEVNCNNTCNQFQLGFAYQGSGSGHNVSRNEMTKLQSNLNNTMNYVYGIYAYYWPAGSKFNNNLIHHIDPNSGSYYCAYMYMTMIYYCYSTMTVGNNVIDKCSLDNSWDYYTSCYGLYIYNGGSSSYTYDAHSNIITNLTGTHSTPYYYGTYVYNIGVTYTDVWNIQDSLHGWTGPGTGCISQDPKYVNNTTEPYDYHLDTGSPCLGTGKGGADMGVYGNLAAGEVIGLLTAKGS